MAERKMSEEGLYLKGVVENNRNCVAEVLSNAKINSMVVDKRALKQAQVATADATDPAETMALVNELKALLNLMNT